MKFLYRFSIRKRLIGIVVAFMIPTLTLGHGLLTLLGKDITFSQNQIKGVEYEKPLLGLLDEIADYQVMQMVQEKGDSTGAQESSKDVEAIDKHFTELQDVDARFGKDLDFTLEGLTQHGADGLTAEALQKKWEAIKASSSYSAEQFSALRADILRMIKHLGDTSGMILDPDLDSYYLVDVVLLAYPPMLEALADIKTKYYTLLHDNYGTVPESERIHIEGDVQMLETVLLQHIKDSINTTLHEDANFYGVSPTLRGALEGKLAEYDADAQKVIEALKSLESGGQVSADQFLDLTDTMHDSTAEFGRTSLDELQKLIEIRITSLKGNRTNELVICAVALAMALLIFWLLTASVTHPLRKIQQTMMTLMSGKLDILVPCQEYGDESGAMARCVESFRQGGLEKVRLEEESKKKDQRAAAERKKIMHELADTFESEVQGIVNTVASAATQLSQTAQGVAEAISRSASTSGEAASAATETTANVQSVASAAEELSASVREISSQMQRSNEMVLDSVNKTEAADRQAGNLATATQKVREVIQLISDIAGQINLLALNATIESARAGEAGKGFAVVASEVKNLAGQTDKSIQDIERVIEEMSAASDNIVTSLKGIKNSIDNISDASSSVASAVEEQSATTNEIAHNMHSAAQGTQVISNSLLEVTNSSAEASSSAEQILMASQELSRQAENLNQQVGNFLHRVREG